MEKENISKPDWIKIKPAEFEKIVVDLAKSGLSTEKIGLVLRDKHGIPKAKLLGKKIKEILQENNLSVSGVHDAFKSKISSVENHLAKHKNDKTAKRALNKKNWTLSRVH